MLLSGSLATLASWRFNPPGGARSLLRRPRADPLLGALPPGVERMPDLVEIDDERRVVRRQGLALARLAVDLRPARAVGDHARRQQVVDAHADVLGKVSGAVVARGEGAVLGAA